MPVSTVTTQSNVKAGMCPHGVPQAACPICNGGSGGVNRNSASKHTHVSKGWSYQKCYAAGLQIRAAIQRQEAAKTFYQKQYELAMQINKNIQSIADKLNQFVQNIKTPMVQTSMQILMNTVVNPLFRVISQLTRLIEKMADFQQKALNVLLQAGEKLANILGEIKNFVERKIINDLKKKAKKFMLFCLSVIDDDNYKNDDTLAIFKSKEIKKYIVKILKKQSDNGYRDNKAET